MRVGGGATSFEESELTEIIGLMHNDLHLASFLLLDSSLVLLDHQRWLTHLRHDFVVMLLVEQILFMSQLTLLLDSLVGFLLILLMVDVGIFG